MKKCDSDSDEGNGEQWKSSQSRITGLGAPGWLIRLSVQLHLSSGLDLKVVSSSPAYLKKKNYRSFRKIDLRNIMERYRVRIKMLRNGTGALASQSSYGSSFPWKLGCLN